MRYSKITCMSMRRLIEQMAYGEIRKEHVEWSRALMQRIKREEEND